MGRIGDRAGVGAVLLRLSAYAGHMARQALVYRKTMVQETFSKDVAAAQLRDLIQDYSIILTCIRAMDDNSLIQSSAEDRIQENERLWLMELEREEKEEERKKNDR